MSADQRSTCVSLRATPASIFAHLLLRKHCCWLLGRTLCAAFDAALRANQEFDVQTCCELLPPFVLSLTGVSCCPSEIRASVPLSLGWVLPSASVRASGQDEPEAFTVREGLLRTRTRPAWPSRASRRSLRSCLPRQTLGRLPDASTGRRTAAGRRLRRWLPANRK